jgi:phenylalanyl-tRNA synthetase beta chain
MGGGLSEVTEQTTTVVLESACFDPKSVRITSRKLGLKTEASARFERGSDIGAPVAGLERVAALLAHIGAGTCRPLVIDRYPNPLPERQLILRRERIERLLGAAIPDADVRRILTSLGFRPVAQADGWKVAVPTFRVDVSREVDLIEEVGRHYGYDRLPTTFPPLTAAPPPPHPTIDRDRTARRVLLAAGCSEALSFSFIAADRAAPFADAGQIARISNPLTSQFSVLRPSLLPGLIAALAHNRNRQRHDVQLFEIGAAVTRRGLHQLLAVAWTGNAGEPHWSGTPRPVDFFDVKGLVEQLGQAYWIETAFESNGIPDFLVGGRAARVLAGSRELGVAGMLAPSVTTSADLGKDQDVYVIELNLDAVMSARSGGPIAFAPLPRYPSIVRDISIVVDNSLPAATVRGTIRSAAPDTLVSVREFDRYQGKGVAEGRVSLSMRLTFRSPDRTLTDAEVDEAMSSILMALKQTHDAVQR